MNKILSMSILGLGSVCFLYYENHSIQNERYFIHSNKINEEFSGFRILQISDLQNQNFGRDQCRLIKKIKDEEPDIIVITGDLFDRRKYDLSPVESLIDTIVKIAPIYYVTGNHEVLSEHYIDILKMLESKGVILLDGKKETIKKGNSKIYISGVKDPYIISRKGHQIRDINRLKADLNNLKIDINTFNILLSHQPELIGIYEKYGLDLILSGHAHGGQFRVPFIGPLYSPDQGLFPLYAEGIHYLGKSTEIVSRGLGNSKFPIRLLNRPDLVTIILEKL
jgi:predicted MPP superfamily phosphohydrolase